MSIFQRRWFVLTLVVIIAAGIIAVELLHVSNVGKTVLKGQGAVIKLDGLVVDENGAPLPGAIVTVVVDWDDLDTLPMIAPLDNTGVKKITVNAQTDQRGYFQIVNEHGNRLQILDIKKPNYVWLIDYAWVAGSKYQEMDNRVYTFKRYPLYIADATRPAVFPLIREGSQTVYCTSRGGSDRLSDGRLRVNNLWTPIIPSTGPKAPRTAVEIEKRVVEVFNVPFAPPTNSSRPSNP